MVIEDGPGNGAREKRLQNWSGIKFFHGSPLPDLATLHKNVPTVTAQYLREDKHVWRPEEAVEAARLFFGLENQPNQRMGVRIIGEPQSGKGTFLFGISDICDALGYGYVFIDGHHQEVEGSIVADAIAQAQNMNIPVFYDSTDYLFLKSRKTGRSISKETQGKRTQLIIAAIDASTIPVALTSHDEEWATEFLDLELRDKYNQAFTRFPAYEIPLYLQSAASVRRYLLDNKIPEKVADYLLNMGNDEFTRSGLHSLDDKIFYPSFDPDPTITVANICKTIYIYAVLKDLVKRYPSRLTRLANTILENRNIHEEIALRAIEDLGLLIFNLDENRRNLTQIRRGKSRQKEL